MIALPNLNHMNELEEEITLALTPCPSCERDDAIRRVSAVVQEQTSTSEATGTVNTAYRTKYTTEQSGSQVSDLANRIGANKEIGSPPGRGMIGCGWAILVIFILAMITNSSIGEPERNDPFIFGFFFVIALALIIVGRIWNKNSRGDLIQYNDSVMQFNMRVNNAWYCTRCNVRFDSKGAF
jgi:hypothetical protein